MKRKKKVFSRENKPKNTQPKKGKPYDISSLPILITKPDPIKYEDKTIEIEIQVVED